jgi:hypothetical protein
MITIPNGFFATNDDAALKAKREELKRKLLNGDRVTISPNGQINTNDNSGGNIVVPEGKLASFYWYEDNPNLYQNEIAVMNRYFPHFRLGKLSDGRLYWHGAVQPTLLGRNKWHLQLVYENNHPNNATFGGSVRVYVIDPDIDDLNAQLDGQIPHLLRDSGGNTYLCTARQEDVRVGNTITSAASSLTWALKWIGVFELWLGGQVTRNEFAGHRF